VSILTILDGPVIATGESLSSGIDCSAGQLVRVTMPAGWTKAPLTFRISSDGTFFNDLYGLDGVEVTLRSVEPGTAVVIPHGIGVAVGWLQLRSGTRYEPVAQEEARLFAVAIAADTAAWLR
jgi:hypothetical protein